MTLADRVDQSGYLVVDSAAIGSRILIVPTGADKTPDVSRVPEHLRELTAYSLWEVHLLKEADAAVGLDDTWVRRVDQVKRIFGGTVHEWRRQK